MGVDVNRVTFFLKNAVQKKKKWINQKYKWFYYYISDLVLEIEISPFLLITRGGKFLVPITVKNPNPPPSTTFGDVMERNI